MTVKDCSSATESWTDECRCGVTAPVLASREQVMLTTGGSPVITPRCMLVEPSNSSSASNVPEIVLPNALPWDDDVVSELKDAGVRDVPRVIPPLKRMDVMAQIAVLHIILKEDDQLCIGDIYES